MFNKRKGQRNSPHEGGQSTVEYIVLVTAVLSVAILFLTNPAGPFQQKLNSTLGTVSTQMGNMSDRLPGSQAGTNGVSPAPATTTNPLVNLIP